MPRFGRALAANSQQVCREHVAPAGSRVRKHPASDVPSGISLKGPFKFSRHGGFLKYGYPNNGWFGMEKPNLKWMMSWGTSFSGNLHMAAMAIAFISASMQPQLRHMAGMNSTELER